MDKWPSSLPCPAFSDAAYGSRSNVIRSEMDAGPVKMRRRATWAPETVSFTLHLSRAQLQVLIDFVSITLGDVARFEWVEFRDPSRRAAVYRFQQRPSYRAITPKRWRAEISLDLLTSPNGQFLLSNEQGAGLVDGDNNGLTT